LREIYVRGHWRRDGSGGFTFVRPHTRRPPSASLRREFASYNYIAVPPIGRKIVAAAFGQRKREVPDVSREDIDDAISYLLYYHPLYEGLTREEAERIVMRKLVGGRVKEVMSWARKYRRRR